MKGFLMLSMAGFLLKWLGNVQKCHDQHNIDLTKIATKVEMKHLGPCRPDDTLFDGADSPVAIIEIVVFSQARWECGSLCN